MIQKVSAGGRLLKTKSRPKFTFDSLGSTIPRESFRKTWTPGFGRSTASLNKKTSFVAHAKSSQKNPLSCPLWDSTLHQPRTLVRIFFIQKKLLRSLLSPQFLSVTHEQNLPLFFCSSHFRLLVFCLVF